MSEPGASQPSDVSGAGPLDYPTNRVFAAVDPQQLSALVPALIDVGFAPIGILAVRRAGVGYNRPPGKAESAVCCAASR